VTDERSYPLSWVAHPAVWLAGLAVVLGGVAAWAITRRFPVGSFAAVLLLSLALQLFLVSRFSAARHEGCWTWGLLPLYVAAGWVATGAGWHAALPSAVLLFGVAVAPWAWVECAGEVASRTVALLISGAYLLLGVGIALGILPVWCLLALLVLPLGIRATVAVGRPSPVDLASRLASFSVIFVGQVILGLIIAGFLR
jgi:hypothetical protein